MREVALPMHFDLEVIFKCPITFINLKFQKTAA